MAKRYQVNITGTFERNLEQVEAFLLESESPSAFDALLNELIEGLLPNLERFPQMGRPFLDQPVRSVEAHNKRERLIQQRDATAAGADLREYVLPHYLVLYALLGDSVYLLSIRHQRQLSFDFAGHWPG